MDPERRYTEDEVNSIFDRATEAQTARTPSGPGSTGLTLRELREIGREVGISEADITRAATSLDQPTPVPTADRKLFGQTIGVGRTVDLPRPMTSQEWHRLVVDLRETFDAQGKIHDDGVFRSWTNSNLEALLEPSGSGQRLRLRTLKGSARSFQGVGAGFMAAGLGIGIANLIGVVTDPSDIVMFSVIGLAMFFGSRLTVPAWARTRAQQFDALIDRVLRSLQAPAVGDGSSEADPLHHEGPR